MKSLLKPSQLIDELLGRLEVPAPVPMSRSTSAGSVPSQAGRLAELAELASLGAGTAVMDPQDLAAGSRVGSKGGSQAGSQMATSPVESGWAKGVAQRSDSHPQRQRQKAEAAAKAKAEARANKREAQRAKKLEQTRDSTNSKMGQVHIGDIRTAQKLWAMFPHATTTNDLVMQYSGGIVVPDGMEANFSMEMVLDHNWGLYAQRQEPQPRPTTGRAVLKPPALRKRAEDAAGLHAQLFSVKR